MRLDRKVWQTEGRTERLQTDGKFQNNTTPPKIFRRGIITDNNDIIFLSQWIYKHWPKFEVKLRLLKNTFVQLSLCMFSNIY